VRKQYHFWPGEGGMDAWDVDRLMGRVADLPVEEVALDDLPEIDSEYWFDERERPTVRKVIEPPDRTYVAGYGRIARYS
jgi:hypothetical protein